MTKEIDLSSSEQFSTWDLYEVKWCQETYRVGNELSCRSDHEDTKMVFFVLDYVYSEPFSFSCLLDIVMYLDLE